MKKTSGVGGYGLGRAARPCEGGPDERKIRLEIIPLYKSSLFGLCTHVKSLYLSGGIAVSLL